MPENRAPAQPRRHGLPPESPGFVAVGRIVAPWGVKGDVKVDPLTDFPERFGPGSRLWVAGQTLRVARSRWQTGHVYLGLEGVTSREHAEALRGRLLEVPEEELKPLAQGQYYRFQIVGLEVFASDGRALGRVVEILPTGADDVFVVQGPAGETLLPAIDDVILEVDLTTGRMVVEPLEGT